MQVLTQSSFCITTASAAAAAAATTLLLLPLLRQNKAEAIAVIKEADGKIDNELGLKLKEMPSSIEMLDEDFTSCETKVSHLLLVLNRKAIHKVMRLSVGVCHTSTSLQTLVWKNPYL
jgi:hypothetical protein